MDPKARDVFPETQGTWIDAMLARGEEGRREVNRRVMALYGPPLEVYFRGGAWGIEGEPGEIVRGFFADRLAREHFFRDWRRSGKLLRRWLMNSFIFFLKERRREAMKDGRAVPLPDDLPDAKAGDPSADFDRAFAATILEEAIARARRSCEDEGLAEHFRVFLRHHSDGAGYREIAGELGVDAGRAAVMARTGSKRFRDSLRDLLLGDGIPEGRIDEEIRSLLEVTS